MAKNNKDLAPVSSNSKQLMDNHKVYSAINDVATQTFGLEYERGITRLIIQFIPERMINRFKIDDEIIRKYDRVWFRTNAKNIFRVSIYFFTKMEMGAYLVEHLKMKLVTDDHHDHIKINEIRVADDYKFLWEWINKEPAGEDAEHWDMAGIDFDGFQANMWLFDRLWLQIEIESSIPSVVPNQEDFD